MKSTKYISPEDIQKAKAVSINNILRSDGIQPVWSHGRELVYLSPLRQEKSPSFFVNEAKNCFTDFGGTEEMKGDSLTFAQLFWRVGFKEAVLRLLGLELTITPSFSFSGLETSEKPRKGIRIISVNTIKHPALINYLWKRGITLEMAKRYLREVVYETGGRRFFAVGFENDSGGYELRNGLNFKGGKTKNDITVFNRTMNSEAVVIFEGFFDFLSALEYSGKRFPIYTTIVLNSCNNLSRALPFLTDGKIIHSYLDNDKMGLKTLERLKKERLQVVNQSEKLYPMCKDFNEYLILCRNERA